MRNVVEGIGNTVRFWWISIIIGVIAIVLGIWSMFTPVTALAALTILFIVALLVSGIIEIVFAVQNRQMRGWGWVVTGGIVDLLLGIMLIAIPAPVTTLVLIYFVGFWIMFRSIWAIGSSAELHQQGVRGWGWLLAIAILGLLFSIIFIFSSPLFGGAFVVAMFAISLIIYGIFRIYMGIQLKSVRSEVEKL